MLEERKLGSFNDWTVTELRERRAVLCEWVLERWGTEETSESLTESELEEDIDEEEIESE